MELASANVKKVGERFEVSHGDDSGLLVRFYLEAERQGARSNEEGRDIFKDIPYINIKFPGDRNREVVRRADDRDKDRFPRQWAAFERQAEEVHEGTPLEEWAPVSKSVALNFKGLNIHTVEHLAAVTDANLENLGHGARQLRDKAQAWLDSAENDAELLSVTTKNQQLEDEVEALKQQIADLASKVKE